MQLAFRTRRLERSFHSVERAVRTWGPEVGRRYVSRLIAIESAPTMASLFEIRFLRFHRLTGDRRGQYAASLTGQWRLILDQVDDRTIRVVDVEDYHG